MSFAVIHNMRSPALTIQATERLLHDRDLIATKLADGVTAIFSRPNEAAAQALSVSAGPLHAFGRVRLDQDPLAGSGAESADARTGLQQCLAAYEKWDRGFTDHLAGDFCFAIWDDARQRLFSVRDQLGVRPLYHGDFGGTLAISDRLDWLASLGGPAMLLDRVWIHDFLALPYVRDTSRTVYANIKRLRPAHILEATGAGTSERRYWSLDIGEPKYFAREDECSEAFIAVTGEAIASRLPEGDLGISMSGGLDSPTLAALARRIVRTPNRIIAYTQYSQRLIRDREPAYARLVSDHLEIESIHQPIDDLIFDPDWRHTDAQFPEPTFAILNARSQGRIAGTLAAHSAVWFWGEGPDNALEFDWRPYLAWLSRNGDWRHLVKAAADYVRTKSAGEWIDSMRHSLSRPAAEDILPDRIAPRWILPDLNALAERHDGSEAETHTGHPWHPTALAAFRGPILPAMLSGFEPMVGQPEIEWRHPYLDLRVLEFLLSLPPVPWARRKYLVRRAMRGILPDAILQRRKSGSPDPLFARLSETGMPRHNFGPAIAAFVDVKALPAQIDRRNLRKILAVHVLDDWLARQSNVSI